MTNYNIQLEEDIGEKWESVAASLGISPLDLFRVCAGVITNIAPLAIQLLQSISQRPTIPSPQYSNGSETQEEEQIISCGNCYATLTVLDVFKHVCHACGTAVELRDEA